MRRRTFTWACAAAFALAGWHGMAAAQDLGPPAPPAEVAAAADAALPAGAPAEGVVADGAPIDGAVEGGEGYAGGCADGACAGNPFGQPIVCLPREMMNPSLFYNFYVGGNCGSFAAAMYPAPMPTPPVVGHTYFTYQPLYPHEFMYAHKRVYHHHYDYNRGLTRTRVIWAW